MNCFICYAKVELKKDGTYQCKNCDFKEFVGLSSEAKNIELFKDISDKDKDFKQRNIGRIDLAQKHTEKYFKNKNLFYKRLGFDEKEDRISSKAFGKFPIMLRNMPDGCVIGSDKEFYFIESKGFKENLGLKIRDIISYEFYEEHMAKICMFIHSSIEKKMKKIWFKDILKISKTCELKRYFDGPEYKEIPWDKIEGKIINESEFN